MSAYAGARLVPFWLDRSDAPAPAPPLTGDATCDLAIVGGGFTGLWAAILAKQDDPGRDVVLVEGDTVAFGGSGRNGGFVDASLTHGLPNGLARFPDEIDELERLGLENLAGIEETMERFSIDAAYEKTGFLVAAREPHEAEGLSELTELLRERGIDAEYLDQAAVRRELDSPTYIAGMWQRTGNAIIDPARLAWGLARAASELGVRIHEHSRVTSLADTPGGVELTVGEARLRARRVVLATNGFPPLLRAIRRYVVPVYDYVLVTEPLSAEQRAAIGWANRQGTGDCTNQFHYYRLTEDDRILWGGYDAIYHYGNAVAPRLEDRDATYSLLSEHFFQTFPQLEGLTFTHRWAGVIDTCSRFCVMWGTALSGKAAYAVGYTGLGVASTRFGARVALDLVDGLDTERTRLQFVRSKPLPFPPEPLRWAGIQLTRRALDRADRNRGRRGLWLRSLDRVGLGFDS
ncbi:MAG: NAD(P)/FAD-dependent oxidoreductase [Gaiellales bacterium]